jgi:hypothetical protein
VAPVAILKEVRHFRLETRGVAESQRLLFAGANSTPTSPADRAGVNSRPSLSPDRRGAAEPAGESAFRTRGDRL